MEELTGFALSYNIAIAICQKKFSSRIVTHGLAKMLSINIFLITFINIVHPSIFAPSKNSAVLSLLQIILGI